GRACRTGSPRESFRRCGWPWRRGSTPPAIRAPDGCAPSGARSAAVLVLVLRARVRVPVQPVERGERLEAPALVLRQREISRAHAGHAGAAARRRDLPSVQDGGGRRTLTVGVIGVPLLGRPLAVPMPDQPDQ